MALIPVVDAPDSDHHAVLSGVWCGVSEPNDELPLRRHVILDAVRAAGAPVHRATAHDRAALERVHDPRFLDVVETAYERWVADGHLVDPGNPYVTPYWFPRVAGPHGGRADRGAKTIRGEIGYYAMDTLTVIGDGTWAGAMAAADAALTAAHLVATRQAHAAYALCRPPGHHAGPAFYGGSCYLNNAAIAALHLRASGAGRVALIDIDAHHGNGTQAIAWDDPTFLYASLHVDPAAGWFPHTVGHADEVDSTGTNLNCPLPPGTGDDGWLGALATILAATRVFSPDALVVSLGVDAAVEDPNSPLRVSADGFALAGQQLAALDVPTVLVQEGGYVPETLGTLTVTVLGGFH